MAFIWLLLCFCKPVSPRLMPHSAIQGHSWPVNLPGGMFLMKPVRIQEKNPLQLDNQSAYTVYRLQEQAM